MTDRNDAVEREPKRIDDHGQTENRSRERALGDVPRWIEYDARVERGGSDRRSGIVIGEGEWRVELLTVGNLERVAASEVHAGEESTAGVEIEFAELRRERGVIDGRRRVDRGAVDPAALVEHAGILRHVDGRSVVGREEIRRRERPRQTLPRRLGRDASKVVGRQGRANEGEGGDLAPQVFRFVHSLRIHGDEHGSKHASVRRGSEETVDEGVLKLSESSAREFGEEEIHRWRLTVGEDDVERFGVELIQSLTRVRSGGRSRICCGDSKALLPNGENFQKTGPIFSRVCGNKFFVSLLSG